MCPPFAILTFLFQPLRRDDTSSEIGMKLCVVSGWDFFNGSIVKNPPALQELQEALVQSLGGKDPLEKEMEIDSSILS